MLSLAGLGDELSRGNCYDLFTVYLEVGLIDFHLEFGEKILVCFQALVRVDKSRRVEYPIIVESWQNSIFLKFTILIDSSSRREANLHAFLIPLLPQQQHEIGVQFLENLMLCAIFSPKIDLSGLMVVSCTQLLFISCHWRIILQFQKVRCGNFPLASTQTWNFPLIIIHIRMQNIQKDSLVTMQEQTNAGQAADQLTDNRYDGLNKTHIWAYGVGHFINDLVAACWFNYLFFFLKKVVVTEAAAGALLAGQICDGLATPVVGLLSDRIHTRFGQRKPWYVGGLVLVFFCFIPLFSGFKGESTGTEYAFYTIFPGLFNIGWAALQISHMSLVPALTCSRKRRDKLNNLRNLFTFISNFTVLGVGLIIFSSMSDKLLEYKIITYFGVAIGLVAAIFFIVKIDEPKLTAICTEKQQNLKQIIAQQKFLDKKLVSNLSQISTGQNEQASPTLAKRESNFDWFRMPKFYLFGICYMCVRLYTNLYGTLLPFYLIDVVQMGTDDKDKVSFNLALVPMLTYASSVAVSTQLNKFYQKFGRKKALFVGTAICMVCLVVMALIGANQAWMMYILALLFGVSQSLVLSTGINLISDVVGGKAKTGAFVFGIYSLLDKFSSGIAIFMIGNSDSYSKQSAKITPDDRLFIRLTMVLVPGAACLLSSLIVLSYPIEEYKKKGSQNQPLLQQKTELQQQLVV